MPIGMPMEDTLSAVAFRGDEGEVLRQASAVVGRPVVLWEVIGTRQAVARASCGPYIGAHPPGFNLDAILQRWSMRVPVGSRWVTAPGPTPEAWVVAPVRSRPPAPPPGGRERRSKERLALELAGLALGSIGAPTIGAGETTVPSSGMLLHQAANPLTAARSGLQLAMESIGRWVDLAADRRLTLLDDLGEVLEDIDRTAEYLRVMKDSARTGTMTARAERGGRFDAVRVIRSCLTLERRLLRDRGIDLDFTTSLEVVYLKGDPNALFDVLVNVVRNAADPAGEKPTAVQLQLEHKGNDLVLIVRGRGKLTDVAKVRGVAEDVFGGTVTIESPRSGATTLTITLPLPSQRERDTWS